jgi:hypothetical protein
MLLVALIASLYNVEILANSRLYRMCKEVVVI